LRSGGGISPDGSPVRPLDLVRRNEAARVAVLSAACERLDVLPPPGGDRVPLTEIYLAEAELRQRGLDVREAASRWRGMTGRQGRGPGGRRRTVSRAMSSRGDSLPTRAAITAAQVASAGSGITARQSLPRLSSSGSSRRSTSPSV
jgi:hypothetical protein